MISSLSPGDHPDLVRQGIRNLSQMTLALVVVFLLCDIPNLVFQVGLWAGIKRISDSTSSDYFFFNNIQHVARMISCFFHFFIYFAMSTGFRSNFQAVLRKCFGCCRAESATANQKNSEITACRCGGDLRTVERAETDKRDDACAGRGDEGPK